MAVDIYCEILRVQENQLDENDPRILETRYSLAMVLKDQGETDKALLQFEMVHSARKANPKLGECHPSTLDALHMIALINDEKGAYDKALESYKTVLQGQEKNLGRNHYSTIDTIHSIADLHRRLHRNSDALKYFRMAKAGLEEIFGAGNSDGFTLVVCRGIADVAELEGQYKEALEEYTRLYSVYRNQFGMEDKASIWVLSAANDVGRVLNKMGHYKTALKRCEETAEAMAKMEEDEKLQNQLLTTASILNIGTIHENQGVYDKASQSYIKAKKRFETVYGAQHTTTLKAVSSIAQVLSKQGKFIEALEYYNNAEAGQKVAVGIEHPRTLEVMLGKADLYLDIGQIDESLDLYKKVIQVLERNRPDRDIAEGIQLTEHENPMMPTARYGMGRVLESKKMYDKALRFYSQAREGWKFLLEEGHTSCLTAELGMGRVLQKQKKYHEALDIYDGIMREMKRNDHNLANEQPLRSKHPLRYETACSKGCVLFKMQKYDMAEISYKEALEGLQDILPDRHPLILKSMYGYAKVLVKKKHYADALNLYQVVTTGWNTNLGAHHPETMRSREKMLSLERRMKWSRFLCLFALFVLIILCSLYLEYGSA
ncbi:hypothetical protein BDD12DRAFT_739634 [Trichophaea hybrida]|nr:hypothetical protein BDD12DRAFT_739634 [Trichophaea hybrida]